MSILELTEEIKALPKVEKLRLIEAISQMLLEEESPEKYLAVKEQHAVYTPHHQEKAAAQLQKFLDQ
jgi:hypothetical protein